MPYSVLGLSPLPLLPQTLGKTIRNEVLFDTALSTVFLETIRDGRFDASSPLLWQVVAHEVGHIVIKLDGSQTGGEHNEGGLMTGEPETGQLQNIPSHQSFSAQTLERFREVQRW